MAGGDAGEGLVERMGRSLASARRSPRGAAPARTATSRARQVFDAHSSSRRFTVSLPSAFF